MIRYRSTKSLVNMLGPSKVLVKMMNKSQKNKLKFILFLNYEGNLYQIIDYLFCKNYLIFYLLKLEVKSFF